MWTKINFALFVFYIRCLLNITSSWWDPWKWGRKYKRCTYDVKVDVVQERWLERHFNVNVQRFRLRYLLQGFILSIHVVHYSLLKLALSKRGAILEITFWLWSSSLQFGFPLRRNCTPNDRNSMSFVLYLKIINTFLKMAYASYSKLFKELKNDIESLGSRVVFKLWIKTVKMLFGSITQEPLGLPKFWCHFWIPLTIYYNMHISFFRKVLIILK